MPKHTTSDPGKRAASIMAHQMKRMLLEQYFSWDTLRLWHSIEAEMAGQTLERKHALEEN